MDEPKIKRLLITLAVAIVIIMVAKSLMLKAATHLGNAATEKKRSVAMQPAPAPEATEPLAPQAVGATGQTETAASAVEVSNP